MVGKRKLAEEIEQSTENKKGGMMNANKDDKKDYKKEKQEINEKKEIGEGKGLVRRGWRYEGAIEAGRRRGSDSGLQTERRDENDRIGGAKERKNSADW